MNDLRVQIEFPKRPPPKPKGPPPEPPVGGQAVPLQEEDPWEQLKPEYEIPLCIDYCDHSMPKPKPRSAPKKVPEAKGQKMRVKPNGTESKKHSDYREGEVEYCQDPICPLCDKAMRLRSSHHG